MTAFKSVIKDKNGVGANASTSEETSKNFTSKSSFRFPAAETLTHKKFWCRSRI